MVEPVGMLQRRIIQRKYHNAQLSSDTRGGTNGKINVIREKEVESKLRIKIHKNSPAFFVIFKSQGTAKENTDFFFHYLKQQ